MSDQKSFRFRIAAKHAGDDAMSSMIADEVHAIVTQAARPVRPGESIKTQLHRAWENLGRPPMWRMRSAWWRDGSGSWSAQAVRDFQDRYLRWREAEARRAASQARTQALLRARRGRAELEAARNEHRAQLARIERQLAACEDALRLPHPDEDRP